MEKKREYNVVYGYLPVDIVNHLPEIDRLRLVNEYIKKEPTNTGWVVTAAVITKLGDDFLGYIFDRVKEELTEGEGQEDPQAFEEYLKFLLKGFATDVNLLYEFVDDYLEEMDKETLKSTLDRLLFQDESQKQEEKCDLKVEKDPEDQVISEKKTSTSRKKKSADKEKKSADKKKVTKKSPVLKRDARGRFIKK